MSGCIFLSHLWLRNLVFTYLQISSFNQCNRRIFIHILSATTNDGDKCYSLFVYSGLNDMVSTMLSVIELVNMYISLLLFIFRCKLKPKSWLHWEYVFLNGKPIFYTKCMYFYPFVQYECFYCPFLSYLTSLSCLDLFSTAYVFLILFPF